MTLMKVLLGTRTSTPALRKSAILVNGTKYPTCAGHNRNKSPVTVISMYPPTHVCQSAPSLIYDQLALEHMRS